jgi:hypothetical protein
MEKGNTAMILNPFIDGMKSAGADVELLYTKKLKIQPCIGDFRCWSDNTLGECHFNDDMTAVLRKMARVDTWVFGVPVYAKLPGELQNLFNRMMPLLEPNVLVRGRTLIPTRRKDLKVRRVALVSTCGWWGLENFDLLIKNVEFMAKIFDVKLARPLLRPDSGVFRWMASVGDGCSRIIEAAEEAGAQLVKKGDIAKETARRVQVPLRSLREFLEKNR